MQINVIQITEQKLHDMLFAAAKLGAHIAMKDAGIPAKDLFTRTEMQRRHGAGNINRLIKAGRLTPHQLPAIGNETKRIMYSETEYLSQIF